MGTVGSSTISTVAETILHLVGLGLIQAWAWGQAGESVVTKLVRGSALQDTTCCAQVEPDGWSRTSSGLEWLNVGWGG